MGWRSRSRSPPPRRSPSPDGWRGERKRRRSPSPDRQHRGSPSYVPYQAQEDERGYAPRENGARRGRDCSERAGTYRRDRDWEGGGYGRRRDDDRLPQSFGRCTKCLVYCFAKLLCLNAVCTQTFSAHSVRLAGPQ